jgi:ectoine hydroxylase-related dioxygenase (phytanoyl-CoA dioxygenase family)
MIINNSSWENLPDIYNRDGVVLVRSFLDLEQLTSLRDALDFAKTNPGPMSNDFASSDQGEFFMDYLTFRRNPFIKSLMFDQGLLKTISWIVRTETIRIFHDNIFMKFGDAPPTPWHQDRPHYVVTGEKNFSVWMSPDEVPEGESLAFIPGSQANGKIYRPKNFKDGAEISQEQKFHSLSDLEFDLLSASGIRIFRVHPGDALIFDNRILHSALRGSGPANRRALSLRYIGDGAKLTTSFADPNPALHLMGMKLEDGAIPSEAWFPTVYPEP